MEYWATWCPPCVKSIPHLTELQKKYADKGLTVIGISNETAEVAGPFVEKKGDAMDYTVAVDPDQHVSKSYTLAFGQKFIPVAFVIDRKGDVVWVGNPQAELDYVVEQIVTVGSLEPEALAEAKTQKQQETQEVITVMNEYFQSLMAGQSPEDLRPRAEKFLENKDLPLAGPFFLQMTQLDPSQWDTELLKKHVNEWLSKKDEQDIIMMIVAAKYLFNDGQVDKAVEIQEKIVSMLSSGSHTLDANGLQYLDKMKATLEEFKAAKDITVGKHAMPKLTESNANISFSADQTPSDKTIKSDIAKNPMITDIYRRSRSLDI